MRINDKFIVLILTPINTIINQPPTQTNRQPFTFEGIVQKLKTPPPQLTTLRLDINHVFPGPDVGLLLKLPPKFINRLDQQKCAAVLGTESKEIGSCGYVTPGVGTICALSARFHLRRESNESERMPQNY